MTSFYQPDKRTEVKAYESVRVVCWLLVDSPYHHDRDDDLLFFHDEKERHVADRLLCAGEASPE